MNNEDFQKKREESVLLAKEESGGGFNSTATSERLDSSIEITSQSSDRSTLLPVIQKSLQTPESNQAPDQPLESKVVSHLSTNLDAQTNQPPPTKVTNTWRKIVTWKLPYEVKQYRNAQYFLFAAIAAYLYAQTWNAPHAIPAALIFGFFACVGLIFAFRPNTSMFDSSAYISPRTRRLLRIGAMVLPVPFLIYGATDFAARAENILGDFAYLNDHHDFSLQQFTNATILAPRNAESHMGRSVAFYMLGKNEQAIECADKAIALDPSKSYAWSDKASAQMALDPTSEDAISNAEKAIALDNSNGHAYGALSELYLNTENFDKALAAANAHVRVHSDEAHAYEVRAKILEKLGRTDDAEVDRKEMKKKT